MRITAKYQGLLLTISAFLFTSCIEGFELSNISGLEGNRQPIAMPDYMNSEVNGFSDKIFLLFNDVDPDGDPLSIVTVHNPINGILELQDDGSHIYQPNLNFSGNDEAFYTITDSRGGFAIGTIRITVGASIDPPTDPVDPPTDPIDPVDPPVDPVDPVDPPVNYTPIPVGTVRALFTSETITIDGKSSEWPNPCL